jgi:hypothetical protein
LEGSRANSLARKIGIVKKGVNLQTGNKNFTDVLERRKPLYFKNAKQKRYILLPFHGHNQQSGAVGIMGFIVGVHQ